MVKTFFVFAIALVGLTAQVNAQDKIPVELKDLQYYVTLLDPGVGLEKKIADRQSVTLNFGLTTLMDEHTGTSSDDFGFSLNPYITGDFRNYYNRKRVKKDLRNNSGNYVALRGGYNFGSIADNVDFGTTEVSNSFYMGPVWGIQRNYQSGIHLGLSLGGGFRSG